MKSRQPGHKEEKISSEMSFFMSITNNIIRDGFPGKTAVLLDFVQTRPKPAYGRQGLDWDCWARIQFSQVKMLRDRRGAPTDLL